MNLDWGPAGLSDEAKTQIHSLVNALDSEAFKEDGTPDFRVIQKLGAEALLKRAIVNSSKEVTEHGRSQSWLFKAVFDEDTLQSAGEVGEEAIAHVTRVLAGAMNPLNPSGVGQTCAKENGYVLCEYRRKGEATLRFFSSNPDVVLKHYVDDTGEEVRKALVKAHHRARVALDVIPELETRVANALLGKMRAGVAELPEAKAEVKAITAGRNGAASTTADKADASA